LLDENNHFDKAKEHLLTSDYIDDYLPYARLQDSTKGSAINEEIECVSESLS